MKSKTRRVDGGGGNQRVHGGLVENIDLRRKRRFTKDIQIQSGKPK